MEEQNNAEGECPECHQRNIQQRSCLRCLQLVCMFCITRSYGRLPPEDACPVCGRTRPTTPTPTLSESDYTTSESASLPTAPSLPSLESFSSASYYSDEGIACDECHNPQPVYRVCEMCNDGFVLTCKKNWCWDQEPAWNNTPTFVCNQCQLRGPGWDELIASCTPEEAHRKIREESRRNVRTKGERRFPGVLQGPPILGTSRPHVNYGSCTHLQEAIKDLIPTLELLDDEDASTSRKKNRDELPQCLVHPERSVHGKKTEAEDEDQEDPSMMFQLDLDGKELNTAFTESSDEEEERPLSHFYAGLQNSSRLRSNDPDGLARPKGTVSKEGKDKEEKEAEIGLSKFNLQETAPLQKGEEGQEATSYLTKIENNTAEINAAFELKIDTESCDRYKARLNVGAKKEEEGSKQEEE